MKKEDEESYCPSDASGSDQTCDDTEDECDEGDEGDEGDEEVRFGGEGEWDQGSDTE